MELIYFYFSSLSGLFGPTPTVNNPWIAGEVTSKAPTGWILAGFLLLLLVSMLYQTIRRFFQRMLKKARRKPAA